MTTKQTAEFLGSSDRWVRQLRERRILKAKRWGRGYVFDVASVRRFAELRDGFADDQGVA